MGVVSHGIAVVAGALLAAGTVQQCPMPPNVPPGPDAAVVDALAADVASTDAPSYMRDAAADADATMDASLVDAADAGPPAKDAAPVPPEAAPPPMTTCQLACAVMRALGCQDGTPADCAAVLQNVNDRKIRRVPSGPNAGKLVTCACVANAKSKGDVQACGLCLPAP